MSEITQIRMLAMIDAEMKQVVGMISNERLWAQGAANQEEHKMHAENLVDLEEYKELLLKMRGQVVEGEFNV